MQRSGIRHCICCYANSRSVDKLIPDDLGSLFATTLCIFFRRLAPEAPCHFNLLHRPMKFDRPVTPALKAQLILQSSFLRNHKSLDVRQGIEVLDYGLMRLDDNTKLVLQEGYYLEDSDGIKDSSRHQWNSIS